MKSDRWCAAQKGGGSEFQKKCGIDRHGEAGIATGDGVADAVALVYVKEEDLIGFGHDLVAAEMPHVDTAIGKNQLRPGCVLFRVRDLAGAATTDVANGEDRRLQKELGIELRRAVVGVLWLHTFVLQSIPILAGRLLDSAEGCPVTKGEERQDGLRGSPDWER